MITKVEMYTIVCDNCEQDIGATQDSSCWNDEDYAEENAINEDWIKQGDKHYCPKCYFFYKQDNLIITKQ